MRRILLPVKTVPHLNALDAHDDDMCFVEQAGTAFGFKDGRWLPLSEPRDKIATATLMAGGMIGGGPDGRTRYWGSPLMRAHMKVEVEVTVTFDMNGPDDTLRVMGVEYADGALMKAVEGLNVRGPDNKIAEAYCQGLEPPCSLREYATAMHTFDALVPPVRCPQCESENVEIKDGQVVGGAAVKMADPNAQVYVCQCGHAFVVGGADEEEDDRGVCAVINCDNSVKAGEDFCAEHVAGYCQDPDCYNPAVLGKAFCVEHEERRRNWASWTKSSKEDDHGTR